MIKSSLGGQGANDTPIDSSKSEAAVDTAPTNNVISGISQSIAELCIIF